MSDAAEKTVTELALAGPQPTRGDRIDYWLRQCAEDMSMAERLEMVRHNKAGKTPTYSQDDIDSTASEYESRIRWYLRKAGLLQFNSGAPDPSHSPKELA